MLSLADKPVASGAVPAALALVALSLAVVLIRSYHASFSGQADAYCVGEWLINYGGGFVRRGLGGTVILWLSQVSGWRPRAILFGTLVGCYALIFYTQAVVLRRTNNPSLLDLVLVLSPFATLYPLIHNVAGQRKEVLMLAMMSTAVLTDLGVLNTLAKYVFWSACFAALMAVNDATIFFLPLCILLLSVPTPEDRPVGLLRITVLALPAFAIFIVGYLRSPLVDLPAMCAMTGRYEQGLWCLQAPAGSFPVAADWLRATAWDGFHSVLARYTPSTAGSVILLGLAGLLPVTLALSKQETHLRRTLARLTYPRLYVASSLFSLLLLFAVANDWTRWFYIVTSLLTLIYFAARGNAGFIKASPCTPRLSGLSGSSSKGLPASVDGMRTR